MAAAAAAKPAGGAGMSVPVEYSALYTLSNTIKPAAASVVGKGGFGLVLKPALPNFFDDAWHEYPENVTKLFFTKKAYNEVVALAPRISAILGANKGHRISTYKHKYKTKNLPANVQPLTRSDAESELFAIRMPYLGVSMESSAKIRDDLRKVPVRVLLTQIHKLLRQVKAIKDAGYIHGDVKPANVMIRPTDGAMTLIDFDWTKPLDEFKERYPFGYYCHPPETLLFLNQKQRSMGRVIDMPKARMSYTSNFLKVYGGVLPKLYPVTSLTIPAFSAIVRDVGEANIRLIERRRATTDGVLQTFDSFGLAMTILSFLETVYPECVVPAELLTESYIDFFKLGLAEMLSTGEDLDAVATALLTLTAKVLVPMREFSVARRMGIDAAVTQMAEILAAFPAARGAVGGGSATRRSRTRRSARK